MSLLIIAGWSVGWLLLWRLRGLDTPAPSAEPRRDHRVSVIIPARNEADRLPTLLTTLAAQTDRPDQTIVVDDHSGDGTAAAARAFPGVEVIEAPDLPAGWTGKSWACAAGVGRADGDLLVFLDADVELGPDALAALVTTWERRGGLVSVQPHHHIIRPVEALSLPFNVVTLMGLGIGSAWPPRKGWGAAGPCMITGRVDYERVGGHGAVRHAVAEDLALADRYLDAGLPVHCAAGGPRIRFRMYRDLRGICEGWSKNLTTGARRTPILRAAVVALWVTALLAAAGALAHLPTAPLPDPTSAAAAYVAGVVQIGALGRRVGRFGPAALAWPVLMAFFTAVFVWSALRTLVARQVRWSGRTVHLHEPLTPGRDT